jgi:hypothetical protein
MYEDEAPAGADNRGEVRDGRVKLCSRSTTDLDDEHAPTLENCSWRIAHSSSLFLVAMSHLD